MSLPADPPELARWRADTPGSERVIHLNNAGAALQPAAVRDAVLRHLELEQEIGGYEAADAQVDALRDAYQAVGRLIGASERNVAMQQNSTVAFAQAFAAFDLRRGDLILTSRADYASNQIMYLALARRVGVEVVRAPDAPEGGIDPQAVRELIRRRRPTLLALSWIPTNSGLVQPAEPIGEICREADIPYILDACQAVGQMPVDVGRLHCDYLAAATRKFMRGPRGVGFLYVSDRALEAGAYPLTVDMHGADWTDPETFALKPDARRFEQWEISHALVLGAGAAAGYALEVGIGKARERSWGLAASVRERLAEMDGIRVLDRGRSLCAIATAELGGRNAEQVKLALRARGINTSSPLREDAVIDMDEKRAASAIRISPHYYNTADEIDRALAALAEVLEAIPPTRRA
ncbi:MAG TPA: aminotransferase class V-fold PLP-dependent enzyme [Gemmatimonadales bacterium]|nr:aminotransferase class V-fold PLP-dependent enzyme [Gemmatimonadales bacterium]